MIDKKDGKPLSKIALLAKARAEKRAQESQTTPVKTSVSILDKLKSKKNDQLENKPIEKRKQTSKLYNLAAFKSSKLKTFEPAPFKEESKLETIPKEVFVPKEPQLEPTLTLIDISFNTSSTSSSKYRPSSISKASSILVNHSRSELPESYKRKLEEHHLNTIYFPYTNTQLVKKLKTNFNKPSPDDIVIDAQKSAFEIEKKTEKVIEKVQKLKITSKTPTKPKFKIDVDAELTKRKAKPNTSFVVIGHVDAGKSTLTGRLLLESNVVDKNTYTKLKREAEKSGKGSFSLAWVMDQTPEERDRGVTIDINSSQFETPNANFTIVDAPGHKDFVPNMITGVSQADIAVLVVDASINAFESGFNLDGQTKEHTILAKSLGINKIIVAVNKMDNVDWEETRFEEIKLQLYEFLKFTGFKQSEIQFIPISGLSGLNVVKIPESDTDKRKLKWYSGSTLLQALESADKFERNTSLPFVLSINDIESSSLEFIGRIETGIIQPGETVIFSPSNQIGIVDSLTVNNQKAQIGIAGDSISLKVKDIELDEIQIGDVISIVNHNVPSVKSFKSKLLLFDLNRPILLGTEFMLFRGNVQQPAKISNIISLFDKITGEKLNKKPKHLSSKQSALVEIQLQRELPLELFKDNQSLGRFVLRKDGFTIGAGVVEEF
ncbi:hypothetical protein WICMUC_001277 [Wickerhamomyces mucosus]|uniref:Elongation factor 1 alpha-like protein n=1 Tax=Wickerhamomyces mucosus TaxID=1378264 RepID=A0A9P8THK5_9ASCO|nr:hypothetical protein WICMUC_001277 [Wickerhamomyces mucosus]